MEGEIGDDEFLWYWYNGNGDGMDLDTRKFEITAYDSDSASVMLEMTVQDFPEVKGVYMMLFKKEGGKWLLDDWFDSALSVGMKAMCKAYLTGQ